jgi:hypothetical protein
MILLKKRLNPLKKPKKPLNKLNLVILKMKLKKKLNLLKKPVFKLKQKLKEKNN